MLPKIKIIKALLSLFLLARLQKLVGRLTVTRFKTTFFHFGLVDFKFLMLQREIVKRRSVETAFEAIL